MNKRNEKEKQSKANHTSQKNESRKISTEKKVKTLEII